jgi:hypothetical protein
MARWPYAFVLCLAFALVFAPIDAARSVRAQDGLPTHQGSHQVSASIGHDGAVLSLKNGISLLLPPGLPIGSSRNVTLRVAKQRAKADDVATGFVPIGPTIEFDSAVATNGTPIQATFKAEGFRPRSGHRLVVAMELAGFCDPAKKLPKLPGGLCAAWSLFDARYEGGACRADLKELGGRRLQFGSVPSEGGKSDQS